MQKTVCELFAGVGGFRLGLTNASNEWNFVWANQWEPGKKTQHAFECYVHHFGMSENHVNEDVAKVKDKIPPHNLLVGGFPCQDYSVAHTGAEGIKGVKGVLWWQIRDILKEKQPPFVLLENVDRLLKSPTNQRGRDFGVMLACLNDLGYSVEWRIINAADYGFPQRRRRIFIFAFRNTTQYYKRLSNIESLQQWIHHDGFFQKQFPVEEFQTNNAAIETEMVYNDIVDVSDNFKLEFKCAGIMTNRKIYTEQTIPEFFPITTLESVLEDEVNDSYYIEKEENNNNILLEKWVYLKGAKRIDRTSKTGHKYIFSEGGIPFPDPIDRPARTMLTSESTLNRSTHVIQDKHTQRKRLLTPIESERLNGFDPNWTNTGMPQKMRYFCMGNALVVGLIEKMGKTLNEIFDLEK